MTTESSATTQPGRSAAAIDGRPNRATTTRPPATTAPSATPDPTSMAPSQPASEPAGPSAVAPPPPRPTRILVVGDSLNVEISRALVDRAAAHGIAIELLEEAHLGCIVARYGEKRLANGRAGPVGDVCSGWADPLPPAALATVADPEVVSWPAAVEWFDPDLVFMATTSWDTLDRLVPALGATWTHVGNPDFDGYVRSEYSLAADVLTANGVPVYWMLAAAPDLARKPDSYGADRYNRLNDLTREVTAGRSAIRLVDYPTWLGPAGTPRDLALRRDGIHLSDQGKQELADWLLRDHFGLL